MYKFQSLTIVQVHSNRDYTRKNAMLAEGFEPSTF